MHIARRVCRNPDELKYFPFSLDFEIMRLSCSLSKFKKKKAVHKYGYTICRNSFEGYSLINQFFIVKLEWSNFAEQSHADLLFCFGRLSFR